MKKQFAKITLAAIFLFCFAASSSFAQEKVEDKRVPFSLMFDNIGCNLLHNFTHNYGLNYAVGTLATYGMIKSGIDWKWNKYANENDWLRYVGMPSGLVGFALPVAMPLALYFGSDSKETQITGLALGQSALLAFGVSSGIKAFTGRHAPDIGGKDRPAEDFSGDFKFGFFRRGVWDGWPSSHTMVAFSMAATLAELYPNSTAVAVAAYSYATFVGVGMSFMAHWGSDVVAGMLMGIALGKTVGKSFYALKSEKKERSNLSFYFVPNGVGLVCRF